jgi:DNA polymerase III subunit beta
MKTIVLRESLSAALKAVSSAIPDRPSQPVIGSFLFTPGDGEITVRGYDLVTSIEWGIDAIIEDGAPFVLPKKLTLDLIAQLSGDEIEIEIEDGESFAVVRCGSAEARLQTSDASDYPGYPDLPAGMGKVIFPVESLTKAIARVHHATAKDETKQILTGIHVLGNGERLSFAATDGHRIGVVRLESPLEVTGLTFPAGILQDIIRAATRAKAATIELFVSNGEIFAEFDRCRIYGRMLSGNYPNYEQLFPSSFAGEIEIDREELLKAVELVAVIASYDKYCKVKLTTNKGKLEVSAIAVDSGTARQVIDCSAEKEIELVFNSKYLLDAIRFYSGKEIVLKYQSCVNHPVLLMEKNSDSTYLLMPIQSRE